MNEKNERLERNHKRQVILDGLNSQVLWRVKLFESVVAALIYLDSGAAEDGWDWDDKFFGDERIEAALSEAASEYNAAESNAEGMDAQYPVIKPRGMQVVMFSKDGRVGDPIHYTRLEQTPDDFTVEEVRKWIDEAREAGATGIELQGGFDGASSQEVMDAGNYDPEITSFEVILWEESKKE